MTEALSQTDRPAGAGVLAVPSAVLLWRVAWRNVFRNKRRTWLTVAAIVFACFLVSGLRGLQVGIYKQLAEMATEFYPGHADVVRADYEQDQKLEQTIENASELKRTLEAEPLVSAAVGRVLAPSLFSRDERAFGGVMFGVDFREEIQHFGFFRGLVEGELPSGRDHVLIGVVMARNLGVSVGDEIVVLGAQKEGGVAAMVLKVSGLFSSGQVDYDRSYAFAQISAVQESFGLADEVHAFALKLGDIDEAETAVRILKTELPDGLVARTWRDILPEVSQGIQADNFMGIAMMSLLVMLTLFSIANTFSMMVFERTREFGMLLALGMRPLSIVLQVQIEGLFIWLIGVSVASAINTLLTFYLATEGIPMPSELTEAVEAGSFIMPDVIRARFSVGGVMVAPLIFLVGIQFAAFVGAIKIFWLQPVAALRSD